MYRLILTSANGTQVKLGASCLAYAERLYGPLLRDHETEARIEVTKAKIKAELAVRARVLTA